MLDKSAGGWDNPYVIGVQPMTHAPNPYTPSPQAAAATQPSWLQRNVIDNPWIEGAGALSSMIPVIGGGINGAWEGTRAAYHAAQGNYGQAAEAAAWGATGFIPGGAVARGAKLGFGGLKALRAGGTLAHGLQAAHAAEAAMPAAKGAFGLAKSIGGQALDAAAITGVGAALPNAKPAAPTAPRDPNASMSDQLAFRASQVPGYATM